MAARQGTAADDYDDCHFDLDGDDDDDEDDDDDDKNVLCEFQSSEHFLVS